MFALFSSYVLSKPYADWAEKYRKKSQSDTHFRTVGKICFPNAIIVADRFHVIRQAFWAMEQVRKNEQNKLSRGLRRYFKRSKYLLRKPMKALSSEEQERLALEAVEKYGAWKGGWLALRRVLRCNPFHRQKSIQYDPVP